MKKLLFCFVVMLAIASLQAQNMAFQKLYCTTSVDFTMQDLLLMPTSTVYVVGYDSINLNVTHGSAVIKKFDKDFNLLWEKRYGGSGGDNFTLIQYIGDNRLLVRGSTDSQDGDVLNNYPFGNNEWVCIMDTNGTLLHQLIWGAVGGLTRSYNIRLGPNGNFYFCGSTYSDTFDFIDKGPFDFANDGYLACTDSQLNKKWLHFFEVSAAGNSEVIDVNFLPNGHLLLTCTSTVTDGAFAVNTPTANGASVIMEMDTLFNVYWQKRYGSASSLGGTMVSINKDPNRWEYYLTGFTEYKDGDCWDTYPYLAKAGSIYHWIMKIDTLGNKLWSHIYGGFSDNGNISLDGGFEVFINNIFHFADRVEGSDSYDFGTQIGKNDTWLISIDSIGILYKHNRIGYPNVFWSPYTARLNPITKEIYYLYGDGKGLSYLPSPNVCDTTYNLNNYIIGKYNYWPNSTQDLSKGNYDLLVYPNPAKNEISIEKLRMGTIIEIYTLEGKKLATLKAIKPKETISVSGWQRGTYLINASYKNQQFTQKIILQ
nr:T9SS type A sorting domain-containing protein [Chitinophagaceae bacterium]